MLALVSTVVILYISFVTLGCGHQTRVEARLASILKLADSQEVPFPALMALCVSESFEDPVRTDSELAELLAVALRRERGDVREAIGRLSTNEVQRKMVQDLWEMNLERWKRLAAQARDS